MFDIRFGFLRKFKDEAKEIIYFELLPIKEFAKTLEINYKKLEIFTDWIFLIYYKQGYKTKAVIYE